MIVFDFCNTLVPFNTSQKYFEMASKNVLIRMVILVRKFLSKFKFYIEERQLLFAIKICFPKLHSKSVKLVGQDIQKHFKHRILQSVLKESLQGEKIILCTATFLDFLWRPGGIWLQKNC